MMDESMDRSATVAVIPNQEAENLARRPSGFAEGVWHPEDLVRLEGTSWVIVSAMRPIGGRGALLAVRANASEPAFELEWRQAAEAGRCGALAFDPHGIDVRCIGEDAFELLVVDHGAGEAIARLTIETRSGRPVVTAGARIEKPEGASGNAVAFAPDGGFVMTSMFDPRDKGYIAKFAAAEATGGVWRWTEAEGWMRIGPDFSGANGITVSPDGKRIFVREWAARRVWRLSIAGEVEARADVDFLPDNLRWADDGSLLLAGQLARPEALFGCESRPEGCPLAYAAVRVAPDDLRVTPILRVSHVDALAAGFGGATGALQVGKELWVASFTGERIARFPLTAPNP
jgi:hypothetical protein